MQGGLGTEAPLAAGLVHRGVYSCLCHDAHPVLLPSKWGRKRNALSVLPSWEWQGVTAGKPTGVLLLLLLLLFGDYIVDGRLRNCCQWGRSSVLSVWADCEGDTVLPWVSRCHRCLVSLKRKLQELLRSLTFPWPSSSSPFYISQAAFLPLKYELKHIELCSSNNFAGLVVLSILKDFTISFPLKVKMLVAQSCLALCNPMDCSLPVSLVGGILQRRILQWVAIPFSRETSWPRDQTWVSRIAGRFLSMQLQRLSGGTYSFLHSNYDWLIPDK